jgi:hypothetical protein
MARIVNLDKNYSMICPNHRVEIISNINNGQTIGATTKTGLEKIWWLNKHHPDNSIPKNIYLLGNGTVEELFTKYVRTHEHIEWKDFKDYVRELIKQGIMV